MTGRIHGQSRWQGSVSLADHVLSSPTMGTSGRAGIFPLEILHGICNSKSPQGAQNMLRVSIWILILLAASPAIAQQSVAEAAAQSQAASQAKKTAASPLPAGAPTREDVLKLFDLLQITKTMDAVISATKQQSMEMAEQMIHDKMPDATTEKKNTSTE